MGLPFLTGFYSKDVIIELIYDSWVLSFALWSSLIAALFTSFYSLRLVYLTFIIKPNSNRKPWSFIHEGHWNLWSPLLLLILASLVVGYFSHILIVRDGLPIMITTSQKWLPTLLSLIGALLVFILFFIARSLWSWNLSKLVIIGYSFLNNAWHFNYIINFYLVQPIWSIGLKTTYNLIDRQLLEHGGPEGLNKTLTTLSSNSSYYQSGKLMNYLIIFILFVTTYLYMF